MLVASKADLIPWKVTPDEIDLECKKLGAACSVITSSKTGDGVVDAFTTLADVIMQNMGIQPASCLQNAPVLNSHQ